MQKMNWKNYGYSTLIAATLLGQLAHASVSPLHLNLDPAAGDVEFKAVGHPSALKINGKGKAPIGSFVVDHQNVSGTASFDVSSLQTGIAMRDEHMKSTYLEVAKYPQAQLAITHLQLPAGTDLSKGNVAFESLPFEGKLKLHGVEKPVTGTAKVVAKGGKLAISAQFGVKVGDYGINQPKFAGITMADDVQISVDSSAKLSQNM